MKVRNSLRSLKNKPGAQVVRRRGKLYVINKKDPRFKGRQGSFLALREKSVSICAHALFVRCRPLGGGGRRALYG